MYCIRIVLIIAAVTLVSCKETSRTVVIAGDSWAFFVCAERSLQRAMEKAGMRDVKVSDTCLLTTRLGNRADDWLQTDSHKLTLAALLDESVKVLYLSLGGNDSMTKWNRNQTPQQMRAVEHEIHDDIKKIVTVYQKLRPDIKILVSGYDYPRFSPDHPIPIYREMYEHMGNPSPLEINQMLIQFTAKMTELSDNKSVFYLHHIGLMHYYFGNQESGLLPSITAPMELISPKNEPARYGGNPEFSTDISAMRDWEGLFRDAFHLNKFGYDKVAEHAVTEYLSHWIENLPNSNY